ncbi:tetratricopeptide repeat protein [Blastococcus colisei]|uniref:Tetratricopeptide repeat protein n=1 Tax=Blastococcus colisei TaxID=1564162 RepID=A0A543PJA3_9ACTN|nr:tetratricopeptide repeat protein [Blastococcus colisei]TQN44166.1 tetratricopeptide repeat protein [Blastococcus colisei]
MRTRTAVSAVIAGVLLLVVAVAAAYTASVDKDAAAPQQVTAVARVDPIAASIDAAQRRLEEVPGDYTTWAQLGSAYVEQARVTADPSYYDKADGAFQESLALRPEGNDAALSGQGALANARHDFAAAADLAERALAINDYSATAWGVLTDARTQLGDYAGATEALQRMLALRPGLASFTRASYDAELHGDLVAARSALEQALATTDGGAGEAFCRTYLGGLAFSTGDLDEAAAQFDAGLQAVPGDTALLLGRARVLAARGDETSAVETFQAVVNASPLPEHLVEFGAYLESQGRTDEAEQQFALVETVRALFEANGASDDLTMALFAADHGDPATALAAAQAEFERRQNIDSHDALAWALHAAGRDAEALPHAQQATALGGASALFLYHRGTIEAALGQVDQARATLTSALDTNPHFSPLHAPRAEDLLASLGGRP